MLTPTPTQRSTGMLSLTCVLRHQGRVDATENTETPGPSGDTEEAGARERHWKVSSYSKYFKNTKKKSNIETNQVGPQHKGPASHVSPSKALPCFLLLLKFGLPFHQQVAPQHTNQSRWPNKEEPRQPRANLVVACHHCKRIESIAR
jgi:hypothetical protein